MGDGKVLCPACGGSGSEDSCGLCRGEGEVSRTEASEWNWQAVGVASVEDVLFGVNILQRMIAETCIDKFDAKVITEGLALAEEIAEVVGVMGKVVRSILKRNEGVRGTPEEWTAELEKELGQLGVVAMTIAHLEGFSFLRATHHAHQALVREPLCGDCGGATRRDTKGIARCVNGCGRG